MPDILAIQFSDYGPADVLAAERIAAPAPAAGEVLVDVYAASVNPIDWKIRSGILKGVFPAKLPMITGRDGAGIIGAVGEGVDPGRIGERVCFLASRGVVLGVLGVAQHRVESFAQLDVSNAHRSSLVLETCQVVL